MPGPDFLASLQILGVPALASESDLDNAYFNVETPPWVWELTGIPSGRSSELGLPGPVCPICPLFKRLAQGRPHSVILMQGLRPEVLERDAAMASAGWMSRLSPSPVLSKSSGPLGAVYIDDKIAVGCSRNETQSLQGRLDAATAKEELPQMERKRADTTTDAIPLLGHEFKGSDGTYERVADQFFLSGQQVWS